MNRPWTLASTRRAMKGERGGLDVATAKRLREALSDLYNACGPDLGWSQRTPTNAEFVDVLSDLFASTNGGVSLYDAPSLVDGDVETFAALDRDARRKLILEVGP